MLESERTEFKAQASDEIYKTIIAFANTEGGTVYIGVDDQGNAVGLEDVDGTYTRITNGIRDAIQPDVTMFVKYALLENHVIRITIGEGAYKPYYLKAKGLKPSGVYIRQGASSAPASPEQIRRMIKDSDGDIYESMRSMEQSLTFTEAEKAFQRYKVAFSPDKYAALGMRGLEDGQYTNLALILSDQCRHTTKVAVFADDADTVFKDSREFSGSVFLQLNDTFQYLMLCNNTQARISGLERIESPDYPEAAIREALLNALVHRDYSYSGSIIINVNGRGMEFVSIGGLLPGLSAEDIRNGISQPRNRNLAEVFHRLRLIESYGTGIRRIFSLYQACPVQPRLEITPNSFKLILPNMNECEKGPYAAKAAKGSVSGHKRMILDYLAKHGRASEEELQTLIGVKRTRIYNIMREMREEGAVEMEGRGANKRYIRV